MKVLVITTQKGGSGKSTITAHLAVEIERAGDGPAVVIDADPQGTLSQWRSKRQAETPRATNIPALDALPAHLERLAAAGIAYALIDTVPARHAENASLIRAADFVLIPTNASPSDLWAVGPVIQDVKTAGVPFAFVLNRVKPNARITAQAAALLSRHGTIIPAFIGDRVDYAGALIDGRTAPEVMPNGPAAAEIAALWKAAKERISELANAPEEARKVGTIHA